MTYAKVVVEGVVTMVRRSRLQVVPPQDRVRVEVRRKAAVGMEPITVQGQHGRAAGWGQPVRDFAYAARRQYVRRQHQPEGERRWVRMESGPR